MKAAVFRGIGEIEIADVPLPEPGPGEVLVQVHYCGVCGTDIEAYQTGMYEPGLVIGHEFAGEIVAVGRGVSGWALGDRVTADNVLPCGQCDFCRAGRPILCQQVLSPGVTLDGGMAEYVRLPVQLLHRLPPQVSTRQGALVEPLSIAVHGVSSSALKIGDRVLVLGAGPIGLLTLQCALLAGARQVLVAEINPTRSALARQLGAAAVFHPQQHNLAVELPAHTEGRGPEVVFVCTPAPAAYQEALSLVRRGGQVFVLGLCVEPVPTDFMSLVLGELEIRGGYLGHGAFPAALDYIAQRRVLVEPLISHEIELDDVVSRGIEECLRPDTEAVKVLVRLKRET
ncbi:MAG: zinc-binding dehydrogenase [Chloroflexi bacterium]|nr:zinc-binding dehydrogenase [Chloroflexota bacterium]